MLYENLGVNAAGHLTIASFDAVSLAREYGTPCYILDEAVIIDTAKAYVSALAASYPDSLALYASKALSFKEMYRVIGSTGIGADVVSSGELYTALSAGFDARKLYFHGNSKTDADIKFALENGVGCIVADCAEELEAISSIASVHGKKQKILLRVTPGIDPHTHKKIITGSVDSKFGSPIKTGRAMQLIKRALSLPSLELAGIHCHIGSQIFDTAPFFDAAEIMVKFIAEIKRETGAEMRELNLGGGFAVRYTEDDPKIDYAANIHAISARVKELCAGLNVALPKILMEPGRSIVAAAGVTLYTVGTVREIEGFRNYVSIDGGMPDNPRYALYGSQYTALIADRADAPLDYPCTIAGRCCESGDLIGENMKIQKCSRGDTLAVLTTGAYNYSMASNYNRIPRPPVIILGGGTARVAVKRESLEEITENDI